MMRGGTPARLGGYPDKLAVLQKNMHVVGLFPWAAILLFCGIVLLLPGCKKAQTTESPSPPLVEVAKVLQKDVPVCSEWTASTDGFVNATIRAQVQAILSPATTVRATSSEKGRSFSRSTRGPFRRRWSRQGGSSANSGPGGRPRGPILSV